MFHDIHLQSIGALKVFLKGTVSVDFSVPQKVERSPWVREILVRFKYLCLKRTEKGIVQKYIGKITGYSHAQIARHIEAYREGRSACLPYRRHCFSRRYTEGDIELLVETDNLHGRLNGVATKKILQMMYERGEMRYERLQHISVAHLYNLRGKKRYLLRAFTYEKTKPVQIDIGERRKPTPFGKPGYIRVDTVHQGDRNDEKGVYHINLVDEVTQWEAIYAVPQISEAFLIPVLKEALTVFPFKIINFHSDNGSEYINHTVARLLQKLLIQQTKSRPRHSNDNGLVESKNGSIIRKHIGYHYIPKAYAPRINGFYKNFLIPYLNFHRPCGFPKERVLPNGKRRTVYRFEDYMTPYKKLLSLPQPEQYLLPAMTLEKLQELATRDTPNSAAQKMQEAKRKMLTIILSSDFPKTSINENNEAVFHSSTSKTMLLST
jgi:hypothetical protein